MRTLFFAPALAILVLEGCSGPQETQPTEPPKPAESWQEIKEDAVAFVRMHPGAAQKNAYVTWKHYVSDLTGEKIWRHGQDKLSPEAIQALEQLTASADKDLIASDGLYACRYRENMPQYRINFRKNNKSYEIISVSDCLNAAPYNIIVDGQSFVQMSGATGKALSDALHAIGSSISIGDSEGMIMLSNPVTVEGYSRFGTSSPTAWYHQKFREDASFSEQVTGMENAAGTLGLPEIACNQSKSPDCSDVSGRYTLKLGGNFEFKIPLKYTSGSVQTTLPPQSAMEDLAAAIKLPVVQAWEKMIAAPVELTWNPESNCKMIQGIAKHFDLPDNISCSTWTLKSQDKPTAIYYPGLKALWIESGHDLKPYFEQLRNLQPKNKRLSYTHYQQPASEMNLFIRLDNRPLAFVTKNGKSTIE